jgi:8-oxo-dGTP diphosphatase
VISYVAGFLIDPETDSVVLIRKNRPAWQAGRLNAVGGKIETGETAADAMRREFLEETGVDNLRWRLIARLRGGGEEPWRVYFYRAHAPLARLQRATTTTDEEVAIWRLSQLLDHDRRNLIIPNLRWLLPLAAHTHDAYLPLEVTEGGG